MSGFSESRFGGSGGGASISNPGVAYVQTNGNPSTAELGNPAKPFLTIAAALAACDAASQTHPSLFLGRGSFNADALLTSSADSIFLSGAGVGATILQATWVGTPGADGISGILGVATDGDQGQSFEGCPILRSDKSLRLDVSITGGTGGTGGENTGEEGFGGGGGTGGDIAGITLHDIVGSVTMIPGSGGSANNGPEGEGTPGVDGTVGYSTLQFCNITTSGATETIAQLTILNGVPNLDA